MKIYTTLRIMTKQISLYVLLFFSVYAFSQEDKNVFEESAELFLEEYSDTFQEEFFEGLKQKGIENYDKAINHFLKCEKIDANSNVVTHELAKSYLLDKQFINAQNYAVKALNVSPENRWYLYTLVRALQKQGSSIDIVSNTIPFSNLKLRENLSLIYYSQKNYKGALNVLDGVKKSKEIQDLYRKIETSLEKQKSQKTVVSYTVTSGSSTAIQSGGDASVHSYKTRINGLIKIKAYALINSVAKEALEQYPLQPFFYYAQGLALNNTKKHKQALEILEISLDYLIDDISLSNKIYKEMANAYIGLNQTSRANMYLRKIKPGF